LFADTDLQHCFKVRSDPQIDFNWGEGPPDPLLPKDFFSIRWTGWLKAPRPGKYTLRLDADDGARLWLDRRLLISRWQWPWTKSDQVEVELTTDRPHELRVEYFDGIGNASVRLSWAQKDGFGMQPVPTSALFHDRATAEKQVTAAEVLRARRAWAERLGTKAEEEIDLGGGVKMKLLLVPPGKFLMGSTPGEQALARKTAKEQGRPLPDYAFTNEVQHEVAITTPYYLGAFPVTQAQYEKVMGNNPSHFTKERGGGPDHPVTNVSWGDAVKFCEELSRLHKGSGRRFRLPTEAEWEYACREGGSCQAAFHYGDSLSSRQANFNGNFPFGDAPKDIYREKTTPVGTFPPNALGLFDMHGNVCEWCVDYLGPYDLTKTTDPSGPDKGDDIDRRVARGGSWGSQGWACRAASRPWELPGGQYPTSGFRVVMLVEARPGEGKAPVPPSLRVQAEEVPTPVSALENPCSVAFTPNGRQLLIGLRASRTTHVTEFPTGKEVHHLPPTDGAIWTVAVSPDNKYALAERNFGGVTLWDVASGKKLRDFVGRTASVESVAFSPDGRLAVSTGVMDDGTVRLWDVQTGKEVRRLRGPTREVYALAWLPEGERIVTGSLDSSVRLWNAATGESIAALENGADRWQALAVARDGRQVAVGGRVPGTLELLAIAGDTLGRRWSLRLERGVTAVAFSPDDRLVAAASGPMVQLRESSSGVLLGQFEDRTADFIKGLAFSPSGKHLVTVGDGKGDASGSGSWRKRRSRSPSRKLRADREAHRPRPRSPGVAEISCRLGLASVSGGSRRQTDRYRQLRPGRWPLGRRHGRADHRVAASDRALPRPDRGPRRAARGGGRT
jgi:formylglycine-generating enzyme required for sulfatase activity